MRTILALVQAEKEGQIESKMIKARQMEEIREARKAEAEKREEERREKMENVKDSIRKKRKRTDKRGGGEREEKIRVAESVTGTIATKPKKKKKSVSFE
jgi:60S ribosomal subunit assembly/export protein LOC1